MILTLEEKLSGKEVTVQFNIEYSVKVDNLLLMFYDKEASKYLPELDTYTDKFHQIHFKKLHYIVEGNFQFQKQTFQCQLGYFVSNSLNNGFNPYLLKQLPYKPEFESSLLFDCQLLNPIVKIIDLEDFNNLRTLMNYDAFTLIDYVKLKLSKEEIFDFTSHFKFDTNDKEFEELSSHKGLSIFVEEQEFIKNNKR